MQKVFLILLISLIAIQGAKVTGKCRALALEGGGDRGAYHAGAMSKFYDILPKEEYQYDFCSGISAGSLNCAAWALFEKGQEQEQVAYMNQTWVDIKKSDVYREWPGIWPIMGLMKGLLYKPGLFDNTPLRKFLEEKLTERKVVRNVSVGATDLDGGFLQRFYSLQLPNSDDQVNAVLSSAAIEIMFPHNDWNNTSYGDGGLMSMIDIESSIQHCVDEGYAQEDIILDAIYCAGSNATKYVDEHKATTLEIMSRSVSIMSDSFGNSSFHRAYEKYPNVDYRYFIIPPLSLEGDMFMNFDHKEMMAMMVDGSVEAERIVNEGPNFKKVIEAIAKTEGESVHAVMQEAYYSH